MTQKRQVVRSNPVLQRIEAVQRTTAATSPVIIGVGWKTPSNHTIQTLENTESVMIHSLHPKIPLFTTLPNINPSLLSYKGLMVIERCFRTLKTTQLKLEPVYHRLPRRIEAHVKICVMALLIKRVAELACD